VIHLLRRALAAPVLLVVAVVLQASLINRLPLPGGAGPSLVILVVAALAVTTGPVTGMVVGFLGGLAMDVAPPGSDLVGESALVCCVVGYGCGALAAWRLSPAAGSAGTTPDGRVIPVTPFTSASTSGTWRSATRESPLRALPLVAVGAVVGEVLQAGLGMLLSDPSVTLPAVERVLPTAVTYDVLLSPVALLLVAAVRGAPELADGRFGAGAVLFATPTALSHARAAFRSAGSGGGARPGSVPRLTFADTRHATVRAPSRPDPKLRFGSGKGSSPSRTGSPAPRTSYSGRPAAGSWVGGSAGGPRGSAWLRDVAAPRGAAPHGAGLQRGRGQGRPPKVAFGGGRRDGLIGGSVLANGSFSFGRSSGSFKGALGPSLFAGDTRRGGGLRGSAFSGGAFSGSALRGGAAKRGVLHGAAPRASAFRGTSTRSGALGGGALSGSALRGGAPRSGAFSGKGPGRNWLRDGGGRARGMGARRMRTGWLASSGGLGGTPPRGGGPGKGWLRPAKPAAPIRRATPGRGWLSRKPPKLIAGKKRMGGRR
jgi:hypothetical protein